MQENRRRKKRELSQNWPRAFRTDSFRKLARTSPTGLCVAKCVKPRSPALQGLAASLHRHHVQITMLNTKAPSWLQDAVMACMEGVHRRAPSPCVCHTDAVMAWMEGVHHHAPSPCVCHTDAVMALMEGMHNHAPSHCVCHTDAVMALMEGVHHHAPSHCVSCAS
eukprot:1159269-Pelagomonas_calceolata.AAC.10